MFSKQKGHLSRPGKMIRINHKLLTYIARFQEQNPEKNIVLETFQPKEQIIAHGKKVFSVYVVKSGLVKCYITEDTGNDFIQEFFGEGELFGEIEAINGNLSFCSIEAISEVRVYKLEHKLFLEWLEVDKNFNLLILQALATKRHYKAIRHAYNQFHTLESNLLRLMQAFPDVTNTIPKKDLANYRGLHSEARTINELKNKNLMH